MSEHLTKERLQKIETSLRKASPGPWKYYRPSEHEEDWRIAKSGLYVRGFWNGGYVCRLTASHALPGQEGALPPREEDAAFLAGSWQAVADLLKEVELLQAELAAKK